LGYSSQPFNPIPGRTHTYYADNRAKDNIFQPFVSPADFRSKEELTLIYSVWRLDGPTPATARSLVDRAMKAESARFLSAAGFKAVEDQRETLSSAPRHRR
jgi:hypothetical protein